MNNRPSNFIIKEVGDLVKKYVDSKMNVEKKTGGWLTVMNTKDGKVCVRARIGITGDKDSKYREFSFEKAKRLYSLLPEKHVSSYESRDPDNGKWGGAILAGDYILSFSGLPELVDEAIMIVAACRLEIDVEKVLIARKNDRLICILSL